MAQSETAPTNEGTIDEAVDALSNFNFETNEMEAPEAPEEASEEEIIEEVDEEEIEEDLTSDEPVDEEEIPEVPAIDAPVSWDAEQKEVFASLPPDAQNVILAREGERDKGFQAKATELATERKTIETERQQMNIERQQYAQTLSNNIGEQLREPTLDLLRTNPEQYLHEKETYDSQLRMVQEAQQQASYYGQQAQQQEIADRNTFYAERNKELSTTLPEFMGDAQYRDGVLSYAKEQGGYQDSELEMARTQDIVMIDKARKYDAIMAGKPTVKDKLKVVPKVVKPGTKQETKSKRATKANLKAHKKEGNVHTAAQAMEGYFD